MNNRLAISALALLILAVPAISQEFSYVGAQKCQICHKSESQGRQFPIWEASRHSKSPEALTSPKAAEVAKAMGVDNPADDPRCLKCHAPLAAQAPDLKSCGVSCEVCHGPGSEYKKAQCDEGQSPRGEKRIDPLRRPRSHQGPMPEVPRDSSRRKLRLRRLLGKDQALRPGQVGPPPLTPGRFPT
jgi:hypothetical protein